jgi:hypothetical protein
MKLMVTGHRYYKLVNYDVEFIKLAMDDIVAEERKKQFVMGLSGMASGVDLWFCQTCLDHKVDYTACIPFLEQRKLMNSEAEMLYRDDLIVKARETKIIRNSKMVEMCDIGLVVWDGNKGGTHNVIQQLIENKKGFYWVNPVAQKVQKCFLD